VLASLVSPLVDEPRPVIVILHWVGIMAASSPSRLHLIPIALLILGVLNALFAYWRYEQSADQQLSDQFRSDANTRTLIGDAILKRYQTKTRSALATLDSNMRLAGGEAGGSDRLISLALSAADLMSADTPFTTTVLRRRQGSEVVQPLVLPPQFSALTGVDLSSDPALSMIDWSNRSKEVVTLVAEEERLETSRFNITGAAVLSYRVLGNPGSSWQYLALSILELETLQRAIDRELSAIGPPPTLNVVAVDIINQKCLLAYAVNRNRFECSEIPPLSPLLSINELFGVRVFVFPSDDYIGAILDKKTTFPYRELFWALFISLWSCVAVVLFLRIQARNEEEFTIERNLVLSQERLTGAVHRQVSEALSQLAIFAETLRGVANEEDQRYVDIAVTDIVRTRLELDATVLMGNTSPTLLQGDETMTSLRQLVTRSSAYLSALTKDGEVVTRLLADDGLPESFRANPYWLESLVFAMIQLASDSTDEGLIEVAFWSERAELDNWVLYIRTRDTGIGGELDSDGSTEPERALRLLVKFIGAEMTQSINPNKGGLERIVSVGGIS